MTTIRYIKEKRRRKEVKERKVSRLKNENGISISDNQLHLTRIYIIFSCPNN